MDARLGRRWAFSLCLIAVVLGFGGPAVSGADLAGGEAVGKRPSVFLTGAGRPILALPALANQQLLRVSDGTKAPTIVAPEQTAAVGRAGVAIVLCIDRSAPGRRLVCRDRSSRGPPNLRLI
jgi:hypothetical protein